MFLPVTRKLARKAKINSVAEDSVKRTYEGNWEVLEEDMSGKESPAPFARLVSGL